MKWYIIFLLVITIVISFIFFTHNNELNAETKIIVNYSKYYTGTAPYTIK